MPIQKIKDRKVDTYVHHNSGFTCDIYLRGTRFHALFLEREFDAPDVNILKHDMADFAEHWMTLEWHPVVNLKVEEPGVGGYRSRGEESDNEASIQLSFDRFYISQSPAGATFKVKWDVEEEYRKIEMDPFTISERYHGRYRSQRDSYGNEPKPDKLKLVTLPLRAPIKTNSDSYLMAWTPELWNQLEGIAEGIKRMRQTLGKMITSKEGILQLSAGTQAKPLQLTVGTIRGRSRG
jgi:hypothetical protein